MLILASITCDYFVISAAGIGIKRLFNVNHNIYSYRRYNFYADIIRSLIMLMYINKFNIQEGYRFFILIDNLKYAEIADN
jgi:hypothetical protein